MEELVKSGFALIGGALITLTFVLLIELSILNRTLHQIKSNLERIEDRKNGKQDWNNK